MVLLGRLPVLMDHRFSTMFPSLALLRIRPHDALWVPLSFGQHWNQRVKWVIFFWPLKHSSHSIEWPLMSPCPYLMWESNYKYLIWSGNELTFAEMPPHNHLWMARRRTRLRGISTATYSVIDSWPCSREQCSQSSVFSQSLERFVFPFKCKICGFLF